MSNESVSSNSTESSQPKKEFIRHLDHLQSLQDKGRFVQKPDFLEDLLLDNKIDLAYYRLITAMLRHGSHFHIKRKYLENRFSPHTLKKLLKKIVDDQIVRPEKINGKIAYHTNPIHMWKLDGAEYYSPAGHIVDPIVEQDATEQDAVEQDAVEQEHNHTKLKQTKNNHTKGRDAPPRKNHISIVQEYLDPFYCRSNGYTDDNVFQAINSDAKEIVDHIGLIAFESFAKWLTTAKSAREIGSYRLMAHYMQWESV